MSDASEIQQSIPLGVVLRRSPGVTAWAKWAWKAVSVIPGAPPADWHLLRRDGDTSEYHAGTRLLTLWRSDTEAYLVALADHPASVYVVLRPMPDGERPFEVALVTASPYEAQDHCDNGEEIVEKVAIDVGLIAWMRDFIDIHHRDTPFIKRRRTNDQRSDENGKGDARIQQLSDVYRAPAGLARR